MNSHFKRSLWDSTTMLYSLLKGIKTGLITKSSSYQILVLQRFLIKKSQFELVFSHKIFLKLLTVHATITG